MNVKGVPEGTPKLEAKGKSTILSAKGDKYVKEKREHKKEITQKRNGKRGTKRKRKRTRKNGTQNRNTQEKANHNTTH